MNEVVENNVAFEESMIDKRKLARNINLVYSRLQAIYILTTQYRLSELIIIDRSVYLRSRFLRERRRRTEKMQDGFEIDASTEIILRERILAGRERRGREIQFGLSLELENAREF